MKKLALLNANNVITSIVDVHEAQWEDGASQVRVPNECDLVPAKFKWTGKEFVSTMVENNVIAARRPLAMTVLALRAIKQQLAVNYPAKVDAWLADEFQQIKAAKEDE